MQSVIRLKVANKVDIYFLVIQKNWIVRMTSQFVIVQTLFTLPYYFNFLELNIIRRHFLLKAHFLILSYALFRNKELIMIEKVLRLE